MRITTSLFNPKMIGKYIMDKLSVVIGYFILFFIISMAPLVYRIINTDLKMTYYTEVELFQDIEINDYSNYYIENNKLVGSGAVIYYGNGVSISFNTIEQKDSVSFAFYEEQVKLVSRGKVVTTYNYENLDSVQFNMNNIKDRSFTDIYGLLNVMNNVYSGEAKKELYQSAFYEVAMCLAEMMIIMWLTLIVSRGWNPLVPRRLRFTIIVYAFTWAYVFTFISSLFDLMYLQIIGFIISYFMTNIALKNIIRVRKN